MNPTDHSGVFHLAAAQARIPRVASEIRAGQFALVLALWSFCAPLVSAPATTPPVPDERDGLVLEALLLNLLRDPEFGRRDLTNGGTILLHYCTPDENYVPKLTDLEAPAGEHQVPQGGVEDLQRRNSTAETSVRKSEPTKAFFTNLTFGAGIKVTNVQARGYAFVGGSFEAAHPGARGWVEVLFPGYSKDGRYAIVYGSVGPSSHGARLVACLEHIKDKWVVSWRRILYFS